MRLLFAGPAVTVALCSLSACGEADSGDKIITACGDGRAVKCSELYRAMSPLRDYIAVTTIDSYGGGFGTGYDSADVYIKRVGTSEAGTLLFSMEDNADDLSTKNFRISWVSPDQLLIRYGHGDVTFQVVKFAGKTITVLHETSLDQVKRS